MQQFIGRNALKQLHYSADRVACWKVNKQMYMIWLDFKCIYGKAVSAGYLVKALFAKLFNAGIAKIPVPALRYKY